MLEPFIWGNRSKSTSACRLSKHVIHLYRLDSLHHPTFTERRILNSLLFFLLAFLASLQNCLIPNPQCNAVVVS